MLAPPDTAQPLPDAVTATPKATSSAPAVLGGTAPADWPDAAFAAAKAPAVLEAVAVYGTISKAAEVVGIDRRTIQRWARKDPQFAADLQHAKDQADDWRVEAAESELLRRHMGYQQELSYKGRKTGETITAWDTKAGLAWLASRDERYQRREGPGGPQVAIQIVSNTNGHPTEPIVEQARGDA